MSEIAKRIIARIQKDTIGTDINLFPERLVRWEQFINEELTKAEDEEDAAEIEKAMKEPGPNIPWEKVKKELGLEQKSLGTQGRRTWTREELHERPGDVKRGRK